MATQIDPLPDYDVNEGGPFVELLTQLRLWQRDQDTRIRRAAVLVGLAWFVPLVIAAIEGNAYGPIEEGSYLLSMNPWARYFLGIGLFVLSERYVANHISDIMDQFFDAPIIADGSRQQTVELLVAALKRRNSTTAEVVIAGLALLTPVATMQLATASAPNSWIMTSDNTGSHTLTWAGIWGLYVSGAIFFFLLYRWIWRIGIWSHLLSGIGSLDLRLAVQHPDGAGGLGFVAKTPIAFTPLAFVVGLSIAPMIAQLLASGDLSITVFTVILMGWLAFVHMVLALPLWSFKAPLEALKVSTQRNMSAKATVGLHAFEKAVLHDDAPEDDVPPPPVTPGKLYAAAGAMQTVLFSRASILPVSTAALLPIVIAGATQFPIREVLGVLKKLIIL